MTTSSSDQGPAAKPSRWLLSFAVLMLVLYACARLGWWQWQRAAEFKAAERPVADAPRVPLDAITQPLINLPAESEGRLVSVQGAYVDRWIVPGRQSGTRIGDWEVALLQRRDGSAILIVRGWRSSAHEDALPLPTGQITVEGRLMPSQNPELSVAVDSDSQLSRVDPALILSRPNTDLFDGYIIASAESPSSAMQRVAAPQVRKSPPGYYLQHLAYVVLWWFFGLIALVVWVRAFLQEANWRRRSNLRS